ncbi:MAG: hypothetical protein U0905_09620 [Pirellulales bacterium]
MEETTAGLSSFFLAGALDTGSTRATLDAFAGFDGLAESAFVTAVLATAVLVTVDFVTVVFATVALVGLVFFAAEPDFLSALLIKVLAPTQRGGVKQVQNPTTYPRSSSEFRTELAELFELDRRGEKPGLRRVFPSMLAAPPDFQKVYKKTDRFPTMEVREK